MCEMMARSSLGRDAWAYTDMCACALGEDVWVWRQGPEKGGDGEIECRRDGCVR